jgi:hypothetical protein
MTGYSREQVKERHLTMRHQQELRHAENQMVRCSIVSTCFPYTPVSEILQANFVRKVVLNHWIMSFVGLRSSLSSFPHHPAAGHETVMPSP